MLRKLAIAVGVLVAVAIAAAFIIPHFVPAEKFREGVLAELEKMTGQEIKIAGPITFSLFPTASFSAESVSVPGTGNISENGGAPLMTLKSLQVKASLLSLLQGRVTINKLILDEPKISLYANKAGRGNWLPANSEPAPAEASSPKQSSGSPAAMLSRLRLDHLVIHNGSVLYNNAQTHEQWDFDTVDIKLNWGTASEPLDLTGSVTWQNKPVKFGINAKTVADIVAGRPAHVKAYIKSSPLEVNTEGDLEKQVYKGNLKMLSYSMRDFGRWISGTLKSAPKGPMLALELNSEFDCSKQACAFTNAVIMLDDIDAKGSLKAKFGEGKPSLDLDMNIAHLDLTPFIDASPAAKSDGREPVSAPSSGWSDEPLDFSGLRNFDAVAKLATDDLRSKGIRFGKSDLQATIKGGVLNAAINSPEFYQGSASVSGKVDASSNVLKIDKHVSFKSIQMEPFLKDAGLTDRFSGTANVRADVSGTGTSEKSIMASLAGNGEVRCADGAIKGVNLAEMARNIKSAFRPVDKSAQKTDFSELGGTFTIASGVVSNNDLVMKAPLLRATGAGQVNLPLKTIQYRLKPEIVGTMQGQGGKDKQGLAIPIIIEGPLDNPVFRPDAEGVIKDAIQDPEKMKEQIKSGKEAIKDLKKDLKKDNLKNLLKGL